MRIAAFGMRGCRLTWVKNRKDLGFNLVLRIIERIIEILGNMTN